jgi:hypothetical protein
MGSVLWVRFTVITEVKTASRIKNEIIRAIEWSVPAVCVQNIDLTGRPVHALYRSSLITIGGVQRNGNTIDLLPFKSTVITYENIAMWSQSGAIRPAAHIRLNENFTVRSHPTESSPFYFHDEDITVTQNDRTFRKLELLRYDFQIT